MCDFVYRAVKVYAMCSEVRLGDGADTIRINSEMITYSTRLKLIRVERQRT